MENMKKEDIYFDSRDGKTRLYACRWTPQNTEIKGILQIVHGMAEHIARYENLAAYFVERGYVVTGEDHLGHGRSVSEGGVNGYFCEQDAATVVVRDVHRLKKMTQERYPGVPYFLMGHSMGSYMVRNYICRYGSGIDGAILVGTGMPKKAGLTFGKALAAVEGVCRKQNQPSRLLTKVIFGNYNARIASPQTEFDWLSCKEENIKKYLADESCGFLFTDNGYATLLELIKRAGSKKEMTTIPKELPLLFLSGEEDPVGDYGEGVKRAYQTYESCKMTDLDIHLYPGYRHEIFGEDDSVKVMEDMAKWLGKHLADSAKI